MSRSGRDPLGLHGRDFLREVDFSAQEIEGLVTLAGELKAQRARGMEQPRLTGRAIALLFEKTSTRTRAAFEVAAAHQGAHTTFLDPSSSQLGRKESAADTAAVLSGMYDAILFRGAAQTTLDELAHGSDVPVYNGLTDLWHPTQMLADFLTMREESRAAPWAAVSLAYLGDARNNMGNSLLVTASILGADVRIVAPQQLWPDDAVQVLARDRAAVSGAKILLTEDPKEGVPGAHFIHTDVWVSMGESDEAWAERTTLLAPYRVDASTMAMADRSDVRFMHCLPAYHDDKTVVGRQVADRLGIRDGIEVSNDVFRSPASVVFAQAHNRMHTIKALLVATLAR